MAALLLGAFLVVALTAPLPSAEVVWSLAAPTDAVSLPDRAEGSSALAVMSSETKPAVGLPHSGLGSSRPLLVDHNSVKPRPIASITKLITAMVVLDSLPLDRNDSGPEYSPTPADATQTTALMQSGILVLPAPVGKALTQRQLLETMLVTSASNYAYMLTNQVFGSSDAFVTAAESWLKRNNFRNTRVVDPAGVSPANLSTARELLQIAELALQDPLLALTIALPSTIVPGYGTAANTNPILGTGVIPGVTVTGLKTGTLDQAGYCLLYSAEIEVAGRLPKVTRVIGVQLGARSEKSRVELTSAMLSEAVRGLELTELAGEGEVVGQLRAAWGSTATVTAKSPLSHTRWGAAIAAEKFSPTLSAESTMFGSSGFEESGALASWPAGTVIAHAGADGEVPLILQSPLERPSVLWRLLHAIR